LPIAKIHPSARWFLPALVLAIPALACSGSGATDIGGGPTEPADATVRMEASSLGDTDVGATTVDTGTGSSSGGSGSSSGAGAGDDDAGDDGSLADTDAGDASPTLCSKFCKGCCTAAGQCVTGDKLSQCGSGGTLCEDCSATEKSTCPLAEAPCCSSKNACGCAVGGLVGCN
jgi:hypothetical protein